MCVVFIHIDILEVSTVSPVTVRFDRDAATALLADPVADYAGRLDALDLDDRADNHESLAFLQMLLASLSGADVWKADIRDDIRIGVYGEFTCDSEGFKSDDYLTLSMLFSDIGVCDTGIRSLGDLLLPDSPTVLDVLDAVAAHFNERILRLTALLTSPAPSSLALAVFPVSVVRTEETDDPALTDAEQERLRDASDEEIAAAIEAAWPVVEDRYYSIHDELQDAAKRAVLGL
ncbi:hypothetical protein Br6_04958 [Rhodococcus sp. Br-6]|nr:hypothetical protein Br6_04958 [Rhodococcus sp. Br-6]